MVAPVWRIGDFGRFKLENRKFPRFEIISSDKTKGEVTIWYSGKTQPTVIPRETLLEDCDKFWDVEVLSLELPDWVVAGNNVEFRSDARAVNVTLTEIRTSTEVRRTMMYPDYSVRIEAVDVNHRKFAMRRRHGDYMSCMSLETPPMLLLIPLKILMSHGRHFKKMPTRWDLIRTRDIIDLEEDL